MIKNQAKSSKKRKETSGKAVYFDYASSAPLREGVKEYIRKSLQKTEANPGAIHELGAEGARAVSAARAEVASAFSVSPAEVVFTGSATESVAIAILGTVRQFAPSKAEIVTTTIEHPAVLENCKLLQREGYKVTFVAPDANGVVSVESIKKAITPKTVLVSVMYAQNEIGTIMPIRDIAKIVRHEKKRRKDAREKLPIYFHTDATQAVAYLDIQFDLLGVDMLSFNSAKLGGPKGIGALVKSRLITLVPIYVGGGQESGLRSGTTAPMLVGGFATALSEARASRERECARLSVLRDALIRDLRKQFPRCRINGDEHIRLPNNVNVSFPDFDSEVLLLELDARGIAVSSVSACKNEETFASHVLAALYPKEKKIWATIRISLGYDSTKAECDYFLKSLKEVFKKYEKYKPGSETF